MSIIPSSASSSFPGCALSCSQLLQAEQYCEPPNVAQANQLVYDQCFCSSAFLTPLLTTIDTVCITECAIQSDRQLLQAWYNNFCAQVANGVDPTTLTATSSIATATTVTAISTATSGTITVTPTSTASATAAASSGQRSWIDTHWKWILMVVILAVGLALLAWLAVWLKRRHRRKLEKTRAAASGFDPEKRPANDPRRSATPDLWGPHQMMAATKGFGYDADEITEDPKDRNGRHSYRGASSSKRQEQNMVEISETDKALDARRPSNKRARPSELEVQARMIGAADRRTKSRGKARPASSRQTTKETQVEDNSKHEDKT